MQQQYSSRWVVGGLVALGALVLFAPLLLGAGGGTMAWGGMTSGTGGMVGPMHSIPMMDGTMSGTGTGGWWLLLAALWRVLVLAVIVGGGYLLYRALSTDGVAAGATDPAQELRDAYARGDRSDEEYERLEDE
jgi:putative membrane protein